MSFKEFLAAETPVTTYKKQNGFKLYLEATQEFVDKIQEAIDKVEDRPFKELFGDKQRFMVPVHNPEFLKNAEKIGMDVNKYDPKTRTYDGQNMNTWLKKTYNVFKEKNDKDLLKSIGMIDQAIDQNNVIYYLIYSRHPIDVLRMSDHKGISSCHRLGGGKYSSDDGPYKRCALADARNDGGIVYLVKSNAVGRLKGKLEEPDIFEDQDRNVGYVRPLGRIRLRRFIDLKTGYDFAIPTLLQDEQKYGLFTPKLHEQVMDYVRQHQSIYENPPSPIYTRDNIVMVGGSYSDENLNDLFNYFFQNKNRSFVKYKSDQVKHKTENIIGWDDEIANIKEEHQDRYKRVKFNMFIVQEGAGRKVRTEYILEQPIHKDFQHYLFDPSFVHKVTQNVTKMLLSNTFNSYGEYADGVLTLTGWRIDDDPDTARGALNYLDSLDSMLTRTQNLFEAKFIWPLVKKN